MSADPVSPVSRRSFLRMASAAAAAVPILTEGHLAWAQNSSTSAAATPQSRRTHGGKPSHMVLPADAVLINANENPLGPCQAARTACNAATPMGGRYDFARTDALTKAIMQVENLKEDSIAIYAGSSEPLHYSVLAFTSPERAYVTGDPGYEAGAVAAHYAGASVKMVPLTATHAHDVRAMLAADPNPGLIYIANPNNPTGTITPEEDLRWALKNKPKGSILMIDEAYIHFADIPNSMDMVRSGEDVIVLRTFSKLYGMAGLRCGYAAARPDLLAKLQTYGVNAMPVTAAAAAEASLRDMPVVAERKKINTDIRQDTFAWLDKQGFKYTSSQANHFMVDTRRDSKQVIAAMQAKNVYIGRVWPAWPTHVRVTVGTPQEMAAFRTAFTEVMQAPAQAAELTAPAELTAAWTYPLSHLG